jgi:hypothetical protein
LDQLFPGFDDFGYKRCGVIVELLKPCPGCKKLGTADASKREDKSIAAVCLGCLHQFSLPKRQFGLKVGLTADEIAGAKRGRSVETRDARIHARTNFTCVYCEGERDARRFRLAQLVDRRLLTETHAEALSGPFGNASWDDIVAALGDEPRNLFGLTVDHLIAFNEQAELAGRLEPAELDRCDNVWLVSAHIGCNRAQYVIGRTMIDRLNVYLRFVWPFVAKDDVARWEDFRLYAGVLDKLFRKRLRERSDRRASSTG